MTVHNLSLLAEKPDNICVSGTCPGVIGMDEMCDMLRGRAGVHIGEQSGVFNAIRRFIAAEILRLFISLIINLGSTCLQLSDLYFAGTKY